MKLSKGQAKKDLETEYMQMLENGPEVVSDEDESAESAAEEEVDKGSPSGVDKSAEDHEEEDDGGEDL